MNVFRDNLFSGKVALVTGGATGIGRGIAEALAKRGAAVALASRNLENLQAAAREIGESTARRCLPIVADVRQPEAIAAAVNRVVAELGSLDLVINNAAGNFFCPSSKLSPNGFGAVVDIDAKGTWNVSRAAYDAWLKDHGGQILNISATLHYCGTPGQAHVAAAKAAVERADAHARGRMGTAEYPRQCHRPGPDRRYRRSTAALARRSRRKAAECHTHPQAGVD